MLRAWAWIAGGVAFFSPWTILGLSPKPASGTPEAGTGKRPVVIIRKITRRVIVRAAPTSAPVRYVYTGGASSSGSSVSSAPAPAPATTTTGGSHP